MTSVAQVLEQNWSDAQFFAQADRFIRATVNTIVLGTESRQPYALVSFKEAYISPLAYAQWQQVPLANLQIPLSLRTSKCAEVAGMIQLPTDTLDAYFLIPQGSASWADFSTLPR